MTFAKYYEMETQPKVFFVDKICGLNEWIPFQYTEFGKSMRTPL